MAGSEFSPPTALRSLPKSDADTAVFSTIADALASGETVTIAGFGAFSTRSHPARPTAPVLLHGHLTQLATDAF